MIAEIATEFLPRVELALRLPFQTVRELQREVQITGRKMKGGSKGITIDLFPIQNQ